LVRPEVVAARLSKAINGGTDESRKMGCDYFHARTCARTWAAPPAAEAAPAPPPFPGNDLASVQPDLADCPGA
jgi:hypothetical protein